MRNILMISALFLLVTAPVLAQVFNPVEHLAKQAAGAKPSEQICRECHEDQFLYDVAAGLKTHGPGWALNHGMAAKSQAVMSFDCNYCHEQAFCLDCHKSGAADEMGRFSNNMVNVHTADFHVTHPILARTDPRLCSKCHEAKFCSDCHSDFAPADLAMASHRRGWRDGTLGGAHALFSPAQCQGCHTDSVLPAHEWSNQHAREARKNLVTCQACHPDGDVCMTCHSAVSGLRVNPHPDGWDKISDRIKDASGGSTCRKCH